ncbi:hypothetical protein ACFQDF_07535 [Ectobacillus funiculus]
MFEVNDAMLYSPTTYKQSMYEWNNYYNANNNKQMCTSGTAITMQIAINKICMGGTITIIPITIDKITAIIKTAAVAKAINASDSSYSITINPHRV